MSRRMTLILWPLWQRLLLATALLGLLWALVAWALAGI